MPVGPSPFLTISWKLEVLHCSKVEGKKGGMEGIREGGREEHK